MELSFSSILQVESEGEGEELASVIVPILRGKRGFSVIYTKRSFSLRDHPGEVCFPGGRFDPSRDNTPLDTALREMEEELGINRDLVEIKGRLPTVETYTSGFKIVPFIGLINEPIKLKPNRIEIIDVIRVPLDYLLSEGSIKEGFWYMNNEFIPMYIIPFKKYFIWGATAVITKNLAERVKIVQGS